MLAENQEFHRTIRRLVRRLTCAAELHDDLVQEVLLYLWHIERRCPGRSLSWYRQGCGFHVLHQLDRGSSQDSITVNLPASATYTYDGNGNLTSDGTRNFAYDDENQLTSVWVTNNWRSDFVYDGLMRRRARFESTWNGSTWVTNTMVRYVCDGMLVLQERYFDPQLSTGIPEERITYTRGNDLSASLQGAGGIGGLLARTDSGLALGGSPSGSVYYSCDPNGNVTCLLDESNRVVGQYVYDPFGNVISKSGALADANLYRFSSKEWHGNSGLIYYGYRFYEPNLQRWVNSDPMGDEGGVNLYRFVYNSPLSYVDPDGLWGIQVGGFNIGWGAPNYVFDPGTDWGGYWGDVGDTLGGEAKGAGAELSFGLYKPCYTSSLHRQGGYVGTGLAMAGETLAGGAAGWKAAGKFVEGSRSGIKGATEFSHWIPARALPGGRGGLLDRALKASKLNGNYVSLEKHALSDPEAYKFMDAAWKKANPLPSPLVQQLNRIPLFPAGAAAGAGVAAAGAAASSGSGGGCH